MVNAWSLLYDELNGTMDENFPVKNTEPDDNIVISTGSTASMVILLPLMLMIRLKILLLILAIMSLLILLV